MPNKMRDLIFPAAFGKLFNDDNIVQRKAIGSIYRKGIYAPVGRLFDAKLYSFT